MRAGGVVIMVLCAATTLGCSVPNVKADDGATRAVVEAFLAARGTRNLEATMDTFADQPELRSSQGIYWKGRDAVRAIMLYRLQDTYSIGERRVSGATVTWSEHVRGPIAFCSPPANFDEDVE